MKTIIIGAGAAGLMVAYELSRNGVEVVVLEAEDRIGGRIHTFRPQGFSQNIEAGAEFIHGNLPMTLSLMKEANLEFVTASMNMTEFSDGKFRSAFSSEYWEEFGKAALGLEQDCTLSEFLSTYFSDKKYERLKTEAREMAQGLDLADPDRLSVFCIREEWTSSETQFRPVSGYSPLLGYLERKIRENGGEFALGQRVASVNWKSGKVSVSTQSGRYEADSVVLTTTLGNLQQRQIQFEPKIADGYFDEIGFGEVLKIVMEFETAFWEENQPDLGFLFTDDEYTFWTQLDLRRPILVGWIGNDKASATARLQDEEITARLISRLGEAFPESDVKSRLRASAVFRYTKDQPTSGAYSWTMPQSLKAIEKINEGIDNTVWFAGEAFEPSGDVGTVEAALKSGYVIGNKIAEIAAAVHSKNSAVSETGDTEKL